jgi:teichuronic acid biosynthesis glycosyltransferase TuaC
VKVAVVAEFYPRHSDPVLGIWAHRQALAVRDAGVEVKVLALHRLVPPKATLAQGPGAPARALAGLVGEPRHQLHDGLEIEYVRYVSPPRSLAYPAWGAWAAPALALALRRLRRSFGFDVIHAHNAVPAAEAVRRARIATPMAVSVHGGDVLHTVRRGQAGEQAVRRGLKAAQTVLANSEGIAALARRYGAEDVRVVHLGASVANRSLAAASEAATLPTEPGGSPLAAGRGPALVTVGHLVARKRHADVLRALAVLAPRHPALRYVIVGDGPERLPLEGLAARLGVAERVEFRGQLSPEQALAEMSRCALLAMPSTDEAFGVAYVEAMAAGLPAIGCRGEPGPEEIAAAGGGMVLVPPGDVERLSQRIEELLCDRELMREASRRARATVAASFTWERCAQQTLAAYEHVLRARRSPCDGSVRQ